ncbi:ABC transporter ATP-binding protein [Catalinimonas sp. 4WD22]|uniref:ABC transporter ATP-binding protein n=1 Tax=Catalinimonas locisalis TaxID=3133978 RepID=UPI00310130EC
MKESKALQKLEVQETHTPTATKEDGEVLVRVENLSKKFCRDLKRSLWYGVQDMVGEVVGRSKKDTLRKDEFWAVKDVNFELRRGECLGLIGHNGAGKSTLLKMLNGLIKPDQGRIEMNGRVGALIELGAGFNPVLTGRENVFINGQILGFSKKEIDEKYEAIVDFAELQDFMETPVQSYSSGMKVRLGFAVAAQMEPDILIIDEVLAVGDASFRMKCLNKISVLLSKAAVIFVSHSMTQVGRITNHLLMLAKGKVMYDSDDVRTGVNEFLAAQVNSSKSSSGEFNNDELGQIEIRRLAFLNDEGKEVDTLIWNQAYAIHFVLNSSYAMEDCLLTFIFDNGEMQPIASCYKKLDLKIGENSIHLDLGNVSLASSRYSIRFILRKNLNDLMLRRKEYPNFFVVKGVKNIDQAYTQIQVLND